LSVSVSPSKPEFEEARWVTSEDVNIEHLLGVFTSIDPGIGGVWEACHRFIEHIAWHKPRTTALGPKIEALPDDHHSKPICLLRLSELFQLAGNYTEQKRLLVHALELSKQRGDDLLIARMLRNLSTVNRLLGLYEEGIRQAEEALEIFERMGDTVSQTECLNKLAWVLFRDGQLDAAENAASRAINLILEKGEEFLLCELHRVLGNIYQFKGDKKKAIFHFETAIGIASQFNWHGHLFWVHHDLAQLFLREREFSHANTHIELAKSHTADDAYRLVHVIKLQANGWYLQDKLEDAKSETLHALEIYEKFGAAKNAEVCRELLQMIEQEMQNRSASFQARSVSFRRLREVIITLGDTLFPNATSSSSVH